MKRRTLIKVSFTTFFAWLAHAADVTYGGDGCPGGTAQISVDSGGGASLKLDSFELSASASTADRKSCNIAVPIDVPAGYSASFGQVSIRGSYDLAANATATTSAETFFAGAVGPQFNRTFNGQSAGVIAMNFTPSVVWSSCGSPTILRLNTSALLRASNSGSSASQLRIDEIAIGKPILRRCS